MLVSVLAVFCFLSIAKRNISAKKQVLFSLLMEFSDKKSKIFQKDKSYLVKKYYLWMNLAMKN